MLIGEIIPELYRYLRNNPAAPERSLYDHVLVDEYQDLNKAEQGVIDLLCTTAALCIVGDDDQSLYSFKHAHPEGIITFPDTHPGSTDHELLECRRCPTRIVAISNALIAHNTDREPRALIPMAANGPGEISITQFPNVANEAEAIASFIDDQINRHGRTPGEILVLAQRRTIGNPILCRPSGERHSFKIVLSGKRAGQRRSAGTFGDIQIIYKSHRPHRITLASWYR